MRNRCSLPALLSILLLAALFAGAAQAQKIDPKSEEILKKAAAAVAQMQTVRADIEQTYDRVLSNGKSMNVSQPTVIRGTLALKRPGLYRIEFPGAKGSTMASDGKKAFSYFPESNQYFTHQAVHTNPNWKYTLNESAFTKFFFLSEAANLGAFGTYDYDLTLDKTTRKLKTGFKPIPYVVRYVGQETWKDAPYDVIEVARQEPSPNTILVYFGVEDSLIHRTIWTTDLPGMKLRDETLFTNILANPAIADDVFAYTPPPTAMLYKPKQTAAERETKLLGRGVRAPDFVLPDANGKMVRLSDLRGKVVVLDFWATWCGPCMVALPHTNTLAARYKDKNVVVLAVNVWDKKPAFDFWVRANREEYKNIRFLIDTNAIGKDVAKRLYGVSGIPTMYVVDQRGRIAASVVGYDEKSKTIENAIQAALRKR